MRFSGMRITNLQGVFHLRQSVGSLNDFYDRKGYGLVVVEKGILRFDHGDKRYFCDNRHMLFIPKGVNYKLTCEEKCLHYTVNFDAVGENLPTSFHCFNAAPSKNTLAILEELHTTWEFHWDSAEFSCLSLLYEILAQFSSIGSNSYYNNSKLGHILPSIEYLEKHLTDPMITNELIAEASNVSTVYFRKLFTEAYGVPPMRYVRQKRIEKAQSMLENGYTNISEIAESVGFNSIYHFSKTFKQLIGVSPSSYMRIIIGVPQDSYLRITSKPDFD